MEKADATFSFEVYSVNTDRRGERTLIRLVADAATPVEVGTIDFEFLAGKAATARELFPIGSKFKVAFHRE